MKRKAALIIAMLMAVYSLSAFAASFSDMPEKSSEYYAALKYATDKNIITGNGERIMPYDPITRAQAAAMISRSVKLSDAKDFSAADVSKDTWFYEPVSKMVSAGYMSLEDSHAYPFRNLSRQEAFIIIQKVFNLRGETDLSAYSDLSKLSAEGRDALSALAANGIVKIKGSDIAPDNSVTRADFMLWTYNALMLSSEKASEPIEGVSEQPSEAATEAPTQSALSQEALEIMRVALGVRADGSSYTSFSSYRDSVQEITYSTSSSSGGSSRPSGGSSGGSSGGNTRPTEPPTEAPTEAPTDAPTEPTEAPTFNGTFDNDNDNTVDDPFDDGWMPGGGNDDEDDDFIIPDDGDDPEEGHPRPTNPTEPTDAPSEDVSDSDEPSGTPSEPTDPDEPGDIPSEDTSLPDDTGDTPDAEEPSEESGEPEDEDNGSSDESPVSFIAAVFKDWWFI